MFGMGEVVSFVPIVLPGCPRKKHKISVDLRDKIPGTPDGNSIMCLPPVIIDKMSVSASTKGVG